MLPTALAALTLLAIALGAIAANVLNVYSGAMSFLALGHQRAAAPGAGRWWPLAFGVVGFLIALLALGDAGAQLRGFLLVIVYWIGPWLGVVLTDQYLRRDRLPLELLYDRGHRNPAGLIALLVGIVVSVRAVLQPGAVHRAGAARAARRRRRDVPGRDRARGGVVRAAVPAGRGHHRARMT